MFLVIVSLHVVTGPVLVDNQVNENTDLFTQPLFPQGWHLAVPLQAEQLETLTSSLHYWWWPFELVVTDSWKIICVLRAKETQTFSRLWPHNQKFQKRSGIYGLASTLSGICCLLWEQITSTLPQLRSTDGADDDSSDVPCGTSSRGISGLVIHMIRTWQALLSAVTSYQTTGSVDPPGPSATAPGSEYGPSCCLPLLRFALNLNGKSEAFDCCPEWPS